MSLWEELDTFVNYVMEQMPEGIEVRPYSGRGMYGEVTWAFEVSNLVRGSFELSAMMCDIDMAGELAFHPGWTWDNMRLDYVIYNKDIVRPKND